MPEESREALRQAVLAGRFFGRARAGSEVASFVACSAPATQLLLWFGQDWLAWLQQQAEPLAVLRAALDRDIAAIDAAASRQLDAVLQHPRMRRLEGSWRGLWWLVDRLPRTGNRVRVKMLQARWSEVCRDIERALEFDQSQLFRKIHEEQFGTAGGEPFGLIACDYEVRHRPVASHPTDDVGALSGLASIAAAAFAPMVFGAAPELMGLDSFADISPSFDPARAVQGQDHTRWRQAMQREDMRFLGVALPRVLGRTSWVDDGSRVDRFRFRSHTAGPGQRVWTSPVYGFAAVAVRAFDRFSWPAELRGADVADEARGGVLDDIALDRFASDLAPGLPPRSPLEVAFTDEQENRISESGLIPLAALDGLADACFGALPSLHQPPRMSSALANANQRLSSQLNTLLCVSRFAHCVKLLGRDMIGSFQDPGEVQTRLQQWLGRYVSAGIVSADDTARYPLEEATVEVREHRGRPGVYNCTVQMKPHHQLDEVGAMFRLVTEFAPRATAAI